VLTPSLYKLGWRQGSLVQDEGLTCRYIKASKNPDSRFRVKTRTSKAGDYYVVASQDCDLDTDASAEPFVELLLCKRGSQREIEAAESNSCRRFLVDPDRELIAYAFYKTLVHKDAARLLELETWPGTDKCLQWFRAWLGQRYTRPAVPNEVVDAFVRPCEEKVRATISSGGPARDLLKNEVEEIRFVWFEAEKPYEIQLVFLCRDEFDPDVEEVITQLRDDFEKVIDPEVVQIASRLSVVTESEILLQQFRATQRMNLDDLTYSDRDEP